MDPVGLEGRPKPPLPVQRLHASAVTKSSELRALRATMRPSLSTQSFSACSVIAWAGVCRIKHHQIRPTARSQSIVLESYGPGRIDRDEVQQPGHLVEIAEMCRHGGDQCLAEQVGMAVGGERIDNIVGGNRDIDPGCTQLFEACHTTPGVLVSAALDMHFGGGETDDVYAGLLHGLDDAGAMIRLEHIEGA